MSAWLGRCRAEGRRVVEIGSGHDRDWQRDAEQTQAQMRRGVDVLYQAVSRDGDTEKGFSLSAFGHRFLQEAHEGCVKVTKG